jgi:Tol biopolymer transport system component
VSETRPKCPDCTISTNGRFVTFYTRDSLVPSDTNGQEDAYLVDLQSGVVSLVSADAAGNAVGSADGWSAISGNGARVAFVTNASLVPGDVNGSSDVYVRDLATGTITWASPSSDLNFAGFAQLSADGSALSFHALSSTSGHYQVFAYDLGAGTLRMQSTDAAGTPGNDTSQGPVISADGKHIAFFSSATNLVPGDTNGAPDVFVTPLR